MVDLIGNHLELYRRCQSSIGVDVMGTLSFDERDERLKRHLITSKELHPALISSESEYKVLQRLMGGVLAVVLRQREAQCPLVRCLGRELLTCLVMQPVMNFASPGYINELIEYLFLTAKNDSRERSHGSSIDVTSHWNDHSVDVGITQSGESHLKKTAAFSNHKNDLASAKINNHGETFLKASEHGRAQTLQADPVRDLQSRPADWARVLEAATQRRTQVLAPENLENLWTKGRNYKRKIGDQVKAGTSSGPVKKISGTINSSGHVGNTGKEMLTTTTGTEGMVRGYGLNSNTPVSRVVDMETRLSQDLNKGQYSEACHLADEWEEDTNQDAEGNKIKLKRSSSTSALKSRKEIEKTFTGEAGEVMTPKEFYNTNWDKHKVSSGGNTPEMLLRTEASLQAPKLKCRVVGAYFENIGSKSFAVYSVAVTDAGNTTWFVKRRYRNFERLHRHLKDIPNYSLHLPPKRFLSSSIDDRFVHQRCVLLDKYLQDLLSIANVAEQHEVWDFLSISSKNYSFGKSTSVMKTLAVNVDDAMDDIVRQFKGVSDGLLRKVSGSSSLPYTGSPLMTERIMGLSWNEEETSKQGSSYSNMGTSQSLSDNEEGVKDAAHDDVGATAQMNGWHSDNELNSKGFPPRVVKSFEKPKGLVSERSQRSQMKYKRLGVGGYLAADLLGTADPVEDPIGVPPEWSPPNVSVPMLNLVDKIFQLNRRGWLRRQVFWISKQILQLMMEDAIDDWLLRQIHWLRRDDVIAQGIRWVQDVLWPNGTFFLKLESIQGDYVHLSQKPTQTASRIAADTISRPGSFEEQLEAARRASDVKKMILGGAPTALVSLIGHKQYRRCAKDIYFFLQSSVCLKQLAYCMLELVLVSVFPELRDLIQDIHEKMRPQPA
ncbi:phox domain-containing protein isoform X2 [Tasmannia lanceolata]